MRERGEGKNFKTQQKNVYLEHLPRGTYVDPQRLIQRVVERGAVVAELLPQRLLGPSIAEVGRQRARVLPLLL
jgi:hypothetical protein